MDRLRAAARRVSTVEQPSLFPGPQAARRQATPHTQAPPESILFKSAIAEKHIHHTEKVVSVAELSRELAMVQRHGTADPSAYAKPERELVHRGRWDREFDSGFAGDADATAGADAAAPRRTNNLQDDTLLLLAALGYPRRNFSSRHCVSSCASTKRTVSAAAFKPSPPWDQRAYYDDATAAKVRRLYARDFDAFGFSRDPQHMFD